jgi:secondary thiamine-phosphate synthase enzyme
MSRSSTATVRRKPVAAATSASGALSVMSETLTIATSQRIEILDVTDRVSAIVHGASVREGLVNVCSLHTTCTVFTNEFQRALVEDMKTFLERVVTREGGWLHDDPEHSDCDRMNADAHLRALLLGHSLTLQVSGGEIVLGQWQRLLLAELDGPRERNLRVKILGV